MRTTQDTDEGIGIPEEEYIITARELLGFAWQIAKGMAYVSDMKVSQEISYLSLCARQLSGSLHGCKIILMVTVFIYFYRWFIVT